MKKLMIAAAIVCAAVFAQAANVQWKWTSTLSDHPNNDAAYNGTVYIINANSYTQQKVLDAILAGGDLADYAMSSVGTSNGKAPSGYTVIGDSASFAPTRLVEGDKTIDYYYAALTTDGEGKDWIFLSSTADKVVASADDTNLGVSLSSSKTSFDSKTFANQGWYKAESVPEPTSGLLLLLGVAGLALKRRRA